MSADRAEFCPAAPAVQAKKRLEPYLLCGVLSAVLYVVTNIVAAMLYPGYDASSQAVSELSAIGTPTRTLWVALGIPYNLLMLAFGYGVWKSSERMPLKVVGLSLILAGLIGFAPVPMHQREILAAGGGTLTDTLHIAWTIVWGILAFVGMALGAAAFGKGFRTYSIVTIAVLLLFGYLTGLSAPDMQANLPTPWMGVWERINIGVYLIWIITLACATWNSHRTNARI